jgi:hypothetical protein
MRYLLIAALITGLGHASQLVAADTVLTAKVPDKYNESVFPASPRKSCTLQIDVRRDETPACWRLQCQGKSKAKSVRKLGCDLSALHQITEVLVAPQADYLAVASVGEGHPIVEIVPLTAFIDKGKYVAKCELNPYPGTIAPRAWQGRVLLFQSDVDLALKDAEQRANSIAENMREYRVDPENCRVQMVTTTVSQ